MPYNDVMSRFEFLSKRCNELTTENADLHVKCDRLTKEVQHLKRTMIRKSIKHFATEMILMHSI